MLFQNEIFNHQGRKLRLLYASAETGCAYVIDIHDKLAWPFEMPIAVVTQQRAIEIEGEVRLEPSKAAALKRDAAMARIAPIVADHNRPQVFDSKRRSALIYERAAQLGCSERTLHKDLRRYWQGGQTPQALLANYHRSGRSEVHVTAGRGRAPSGNHNTFQLSDSDIRNFQDVIKKKYLKDKRTTVVDAYNHMLTTKYNYMDGNGKTCLKGIGDYPSKRQFRHFLDTNYNLESRLRSREGDKDFERDHRAKVGTIAMDCLGVGHIYEIDASICDVYLVSTADVTKIVGKPTYYLIIDRWSRLIVGFYIGLENASWICAMESILSIAADKNELCSLYGVPYNPEDWPAHGVMPKEFLADRGEMISKSSSQISDDLGLIVTNVPGQRPDWKPLVECGFKLTHGAIHDITPAYDPPSNATKRRGKHYEKDACLTLKDFGFIILSAIIAHNRKAIRAYPHTLKQMSAGVIANPISLWNEDVILRMGALAKYKESTVRYALLPRENAKVTAEGILFRDCYYTCPEAVAEGWFVKARKSHYSIKVSFDTRSANCIYVHVSVSNGQPIRADLSGRSIKYKGLSLAEVAFYEKLRKAVMPEVEHSHNASAFDLITKTKPIVDAAKKRLSNVKSKTSRSARKADTKADRQAELSQERNERAEATAMMERPQTGDSAQVVPISAAKSSNSPTSSKSVAEDVEDKSNQKPNQVTTPPANSATSATNSKKPPTLEELAIEARKRMFHG
ncbi:hypothetical protein SAMN05216303_11133 [Rhodoferax sp. OV413]|uniref:hypothetical protein n=1 Tax=Rhodoferax sp. OV413 TaxID=1855285 RepID=UPI0008893466|nr:hypothetical protein [Rhodoferax sp. OV413]SDP92893.1 hypothetical protein SAMN05216303_11133 [Rhodoferax sp. OV413]